jgi:CubicO group peptidase (beta-lactamase class C family)
VFQFRVHQHGTFSRTIEVIEDGIRDRLHLGAQLYVSRHGELLIDAAFGEAREGMPMKAETITLWFSAGKPLTAIALAQLVERGLIDWNTPVADVIPEFAQGGKERITAAHVLTHTAGLHALDPIDPALSMEEKLARIFEFALPLDWVPGERAAYSSTAGWYVLALMVERMGGSPLDAVIRSEAFRRSGLATTRLCFDATELAPMREQCGLMYDTSGVAPVDLGFWNSDAGFTTLVPGGSARGPVRELGRIYGTLLRGGGALLRPETVRAITSRPRTELFDEMFQFKTDMGFGFIMNSNRDGLQMPYGYGRAASRETFGHSGNQSSCAFADPAYGLAVACATNGLPGERKHQQRQRAINNAIYQDLGLVEQGRQSP